MDECDHLYSELGTQASMTKVTKVTKDDVREFAARSNPDRHGYWKLTYHRRLVDLRTALDMLFVVAKEFAL